MLEYVNRQGKLSLENLRWTLRISPFLFLSLSIFFFSLSIFFFSLSLFLSLSRYLSLAGSFFHSSFHWAHFSQFLLLPPFSNILMLSFSPLLFPHSLEMGWMLREIKTKYCRCSEGAVAPASSRFWSKGEKRTRWDFIKKLWISFANVLKKRNLQRKQNSTKTCFRFSFSRVESLQKWFLGWVVKSAHNIWSPGFESDRIKLVWAELSNLMKNIKITQFRKLRVLNK